MSKYSTTDKDRVKAYTSIRFDSLSNLWLIDSEGKVSMWEKPVSSPCKKPKEVAIQEAEQPMIPCRHYLTSLGKNDEDGFTKK